MRRGVLTGILMMAFFVSGQVQADEGMWVYNNLPRTYLKEKYGFEATPEWAEHVMKASVRFNSGGSGSFVSADGLVITNHHVASDTLYKISTKENNYHRDGFLAKTREQEIPATDLELNQLVEILDVTERVNQSTKPDMSDADALLARQAEMAKIEQESLEKTGLRSDVITLYRGGQYHLYRYKKYTDVRLVFAPESEIAFFGGDPDNFEFPRYDLDVTFFRVYEDGKPAKIDHFFQWNSEGAKEGELVFVSGNPARTRRLYTVAAMKYLRDSNLPRTLGYLWRKEILLQQYSQESEEAERRARDELFGIQNSRKASTGMLMALQDPAFFAAKLRAEQTLRQAVASDPKYATAWDLIEKAQKESEKIARPYNLWEGGQAFGSDLFGFARSLIRMAAEDKLDSPQRLREYRGSARASLLQQLTSEVPIYLDLEQVKLADGLSLMCETLGGNHELVQQILAGKSPQSRAAELIGGTKLHDASFRKLLAEGGQEAIDQSDDPLILLARFIDPTARDLRKRMEENVQEVERKGYALIAEAVFKTQGTNTYPDATFTLRLSFGTVQGYTEGNNTIAPWTTLGGAFEHEKAHGGKSPWKLPESWHANQAELDPSTPYNFVSTADIIGGNSGSPVFNRKAEFVGIIFDGNIQSLGADFFYSDKQGRAVSVHSASITESLRKIYEAHHIVEELENPGK